MDARRFVVLALVVVATVGVLSSALRKPDRKGGVTVVVPRDLHDSGPANQSVKRKAVTKKRRRVSGQSGHETVSPASPSGASNRDGALKSPTRPGARKQPSKPRKRKTPRTHPDRRPSSQEPSKPPQTTNPPPSPHRPPSVVELNPPVGPTVCDPVVSVRCP